MRSDLDHLPPAKQRELERVVQILFEEFEESIGRATQDWKRRGRILKILLFGSYARGTFVDEPHTAKGYKSDFDLLIIVNDERLTDRVKYWVKAEDRLIRDLSITKTLKTPVNFIVHTLHEVNQGLADGRYFFIDVAKEGIALYQSEDSELPEPKPKTPAQALALAKEYYEEWFSAAAGRGKLAKYAVAEGLQKHAAFEYHQTAESLYNCVLLVCIFHSPAIHNLAFLRTQAERIDRRLTEVWPMDSRRERAMFQKLKESYIKARYSRQWRISDEELNWFSERVEELSSVVETICLERIEMLERSAAA